MRNKINLGEVMSKRFTDTDKWKNPWFRNLPGKYKLIYVYMLDSCDNLGVMHLDFELISFILKEEFLLEDFKKNFEEKLHFIAPDKIIIKGFVAYQQHKNNAMMKKHIEKLIDSHRIRELYENGTLA